MSLRKPIFAGQFYPLNRNVLLAQIEKFTRNKKDALPAKAIIMPHAGYMYSGSVAGKTAATVKIPDTVIILGPNHTGVGASYSLMCGENWDTPLGEVKIEEELAKLILNGSKFFKSDTLAHIHEHSLEVELPFLKFFNENLRIVPIVIKDFNLKNYQLAGEELAASIIKYAKPVLIVASSDMTHYEPHETAKAKDREVINAILELNPEKMFSLIMQKEISMCGFAPVEIALYAAKILGATTAKLVDYQTSGDTSGDYSSVVGYAGMVIK